MTIQLTGYSISAYCLVLLHVLKELGLSYEFTQPNSFEEIKTPEYLATKHPFGKIPSLNDDGFQIYETRAIARYLVKKYQAALVEQFISVEISYYTQPLGKLVGQLVFAKRRGNEPDLKIINEAREELEKVLDVYEKLLEDKDYLTGEFSLADLLHIPLTNYAIKAGENDLWNKRPNVSRWWKNISERECWKNILNEYTLA
ncbi:glutathione S-transferase [Rhizophagus irregularis]|nr:glutathione S-transferase [Rhizophagus irregularis]